MLPDLFELLIGQIAFLVDDHVRHTYLADVMQERREIDLPAFLFRKPCSFCDLPRNGSYSCGMAVSIPVLRIDGARERLRGLLEHGGFSFLSFLVGFELVSPGGLDRADQISERERVEYYDDNDHADTRERKAVGEYLDY